jgi:hypothetical protein
VKRGSEWRWSLLYSAHSERVDTDGDKIGNLSIINKKGNELVVSNFLRPLIYCGRMISKGEGGDSLASFHKGLSINTRMEGRKESVSYSILIKYLLTLVPQGPCAAATNRDT